MRDQVKDIYNLIANNTFIENIGAQYVDANTSLYDSKVGGLPYLDTNHPLPYDDQGKPMVFLAQINFSQVPPCGIPFPKQGLLQFFVREDMPSDENVDDLISKDYKKIRFIADIHEIEETQAIEEAYQNINSHKFLKGSYALEFERKADFYSMNNSYKYESLFINLWNKHYPEEPITSLKDEWRDWLYDLDEDIYAPHQHYMASLGGYPYIFTEDPTPPDYATSLLSLEGFDHGPDHYLNFGPDGLGHFLIRPDDLEQMTLDRVFFFWEY